MKQLGHKIKKSTGIALFQATTIYRNTMQPRPDMKKKEKVIRGGTDNKRGSEIFKSIKAHHNLSAAQERLVCHIACHLLYCAPIDVGELGAKRSKEHTHAFNTFTEATSNIHMGEQCA